MSSANEGEIGDNPTFQPVHTVLKKTVEHLDEFPTHASVPKTRYSVPRLAAALLEHSLDPIDLGFCLWNALRVRPSPSAWRQLVAGLNEQEDIDDGSKSVKIGRTGIKNMADIIRSSAPVQLILYRWTDKYFNGLFQPMCRLSRSSTVPSYSPGRGVSRDPKFSRYLFTRDGPSCHITGTIHLGAKQEDVDEWTKNFAEPGQAIYMDELTASHIIPFSMASDKRAVTSRSCLAEFSGNTISEMQIAKDSINDPTNRIMIEKEYRVRFVDKNLPKSLEGCDGHILHFGQWETTRKPNKPSYTSLPNPAYLRTHLAIAKVLHASGAGEVIDQIFQEEELLKESEMEMSNKRRHLLNFDDEESDERSSRSTSVD